MNTPITFEQFSDIASLAHLFVSDYEVYHSSFAVQKAEWTLINLITEDLIVINKDTKLSITKQEGGGFMEITAIYNNCAYIFTPVHAFVM